MPVRLATHDDLTAITAMGSQFLAKTKYARILDTRPNDIHHAMAILLEHGRIWVAEVDGVVRGFLAAIRQPLWFSPGTFIALEAAWWMEETHRGRPEGVRLLLEFERWAKDQGVAAICMSDIVLEGESAAERILARLGYQVTERTFVKGLG